MFPLMRTALAATIFASLSFSVPMRAIVFRADPAWTVATGAVIVNCPLTVGGSFDAKTSSLKGRLVAGSSNASALAGEIEVDLASLDTGIDLRNTHLRERYLEVGKGTGFDKAVLSGIALDRPVAGLSGLVRFSGNVTIHGVTKAISGEAKVHPSGAGLKVEASFPVHLPDFDIPKPRYLGVGVKDDVRVKVVFDATPR